MSKLEEKFRDYVYWSDDRQDIIKQCVEIAEQECIGFGEWMNSHTNDDFRYGKFRGMDTKQIFQLYKKSKENDTQL